MTRVQWQVRNASPNDAQAAAEAADAALDGGLEADAIPLLEAALRAHPRDARLWQLLALAHRGLEDLAPAVEAMRRAAELAPRDALIAHGLARTTLEAGLPATALFDRALALSPLDASVILGRAAAQYAGGRLGAAIEDLDAQLHRHPGWVEGHATLARLRWMAGERDGFARSFEAALSLAPAETAIWKGLLDTLAQAEMYGAGLAVVARGRALAGPDPLFDAYEAVCASESGMIEAADRLFARLGPPRDIAMAVRRVRHLLRAGRPEQALALAEPLAPQAGGELWPYVSLGWRLTGDPRREWLEGDPRFVGVYDIAERLPPLDALARCLRGLHLASEQPLEQSVRGGTQTDGPLFARIEPEIRALRRAVVEAVEAHVAGLPPPIPGHPLLGGPRGPVRFSGSWSVRLTGGGRHANHLHPAGWLSSALYVALPGETERGSAPAGWLTLGEPQESLGLGLAAFRTIEPKPGRLVLFPSTMWHGTVPFGEGERLTVAFDVAPTAP
jgi:tetratricopeptide (TPR) repeat protein